ncbi:fumarylacetoacetate hydrolase family protein [Microbispora sp. H13382]|uniref:fumarylacetoacetate hydrolase family protein n=1 Tax=Microbispora sp. H13382 TaxID=2729112 RepID=UPI001601E597|nr:fumarylacetoacetate hydrolase family protein [Microbispora sp. H13382]
MRLGVFDDDRLGVIHKDEVLDVTEIAGVHSAGRQGLLHALIACGQLEARLTEEALRSAPRVANPRWRAPLPHPDKILGAPANYRAHVEEMGNPTTINEWGLFLKASSSVIGDGGTVELPYTDVRTDQEGELAVVIGREARHVSADEALDYVFGYTCLLDITTRSTEDRSTRKSYDTFTPIGPYIVTKDEIADPDDLRLRCWVGDDLRQDASTSAMIFGVPQLIAYASSVMTLFPGDVIATGTPEGVGPLSDGDRIVVEIEQVGRLTATVSSNGAVPYADRPQAKV